MLRAHIKYENDLTQYCDLAQRQIRIILALFMDIPSRKTKRTDAYGSIVLKYILY